MNKHEQPSKLSDLDPALGIGRLFGIIICTYIIVIGLYWLSLYL